MLVASKGPFDYVLCSDCVYDNDAFDMLATTLAGLSSSHTTVLVAFKERKMNGRGSGCEVERFFERVGLDFTVRSRVARLPPWPVQSPPAEASGSCRPSRSRRGQARWQRRLRRRWFPV